MRGGRRKLVALLGVCILLGASALVVRAATTSPQYPDGASPLERFDPQRVGHIEQQVWEAYYYREWPRLFQLLLELVQDQFGLSGAQALEATYLATRAQVVWAERGASGGEAEEYMRQFYALVREPAGGRYDPARAAALEINWWAVHRNRAQYPDTTALVDALAALSAEVYQLSPQVARPAAHHRAEAMEASDRWIRGGKDRGSPLLATVREELVQSYQALHEALAARRDLAAGAGQGGVIPFDTIEKGLNSGHDQASNYVVTTRDDWVALWGRAHANMVPSPPLPEIDFTQRMVVGVFLGSRPSGGHSVEITSIVDTGSALEVSARAESPGRGCLTTGALTEPYHLVQAARVDRPAAFALQQVVVDCPS